MRQRAVLIVASVMALLIPTGSASAASFAGDPDSLGTIPDGGSDCSPVQQAEVTFPVTGLSPPISNVALTISFSGEERAGHLSAVLIAPGGVPSKTIIHRTGMTGGNPGGDDSILAGPYTFTDSAPASPSWPQAAAATASGGPIPSGSYRVIEDVNDTLLTPTFEAAIPNGTWTLRFRDYCDGSLGAVSAATLKLNEQAVPPAPGPTGQRAAALKKCKKKKPGKKRKRCKRKANLLPE